MGKIWTRVITRKGQVPVKEEGVKEVVTTGVMKRTLPKRGIGDTEPTRLVLRKRQRK